MDSSESLSSVDLDECEVTDEKSPTKTKIAKAETMNNNKRRSASDSDYDSEENEIVLDLMPSNPIMLNKHQSQP